MVDSLKDSISYANASTNINVIEVLPTCNKVSASKNRNWGIDNAKGDIIVMIDDDVEVVETNWICTLLDPLLAYKEDVSIIAPRLTTRNKVPTGQLGNDGWHDFREGLKVACHSPKTKLNLVCSACIAFFKSNGVKFDEDYPDACYEDTDFCMRTNKKFPNKHIIINEHSKLAHLNESKWRVGGTWEHNKNLFATKWGIRI